MRTLLILVVVVAIALIAGDRVAVVIAQNQIGRQIAAEYNLAQRPSVEIAGFPFLTQAAAGTYRTIDIGVGDWSNDTITVADLDVTLTDVSAPLADLIDNRTANLVAATATATALVPYDVVRDFAPEGVETIANSPEGLRVTGTFPIAGLDVPATITVTVAPTADGIEVTPIAAQPANGGPTISLSVLRRTLTFVVPLQRLPFGAQLTAIQPTDNGLHTTSVAHNVRFSDLP
ncbi:DUF2993 domain-containing protein [Nocardia halotolerans]|uniref:DUF2993 domain-containing protein n=1 Tax=Nocardia halotolerans TaxID=1755878 RepID=A0ABV8VEY6_9NOCA